MALGIAFYFTKFSEPHIATLIIAIIAGVSAISFFKKLPILGLIGFLMFGFGYAGIYTHIKYVPILKHDIHGIEIFGHVMDVEQKDEKQRLTIRTDNFGTVRISTKSDIKINIGDTISGNGGLFKPKPADMPHGFDFAKNLYFNNISATGYFNDIKICYTTDSNVYNPRTHIHKIANSILVDTLVLGYKNTIPRNQTEVWRAIGMSHIWSISGYHLTLITGWLFILFYMIFRSCPYMVRRIPARIPALLCTWVGLGGYVLLSGANIATLRAFIMATLVIVAFILGRNALSLRMATFAFLILAIVNPHYVMTAGFQLSFAAIFGIIWLWQDLNPHTPNSKPLKYLYTAVLTAFIATLFTTPFTIMHFSTFPIYSILGNIIFLPIFSFIIMPLVIIGTATVLCGIHTPILLAHNIYDHILKVAEHIANLPLSRLTVTNIPNTTVVMFILAFACLILVRNIDTYKNLLMRHLNIVFFGIFSTAGFIVWAFTPRPVFYIAHDHKLIGAVIDKKLKFNKSRDSGNYFAFNTWKKSNGEAPDTPNERLPKESGVYTISYYFGKIVYLPNFASLSKNINTVCNDSKTKYIVSYFDIDSENCDNKIIRNGGVIYKSGRISYTPFNRWWHNRPE